MDFISASPASLNMGPRSGFRTGIAVSLLLHALLIYGYRMQRSAAAPSAPPAERLTGWLRPLAAPPAPQMARVEPKAVTAPRSPAAQPRQPPMRKKTEQLAVTAPAAQPGTLPAAPSAPSTAQVPADPFAEPAAPVKPGFDIDAARRTARKVANEKDPAKIGTGLERLPEKPLADETQLARNIAGAKRGDCRTAYAGAGLLAPLFMLMDKKDSGCKF